MRGPNTRTSRNPSTFCKDDRRLSFPVYFVRNASAASLCPRYAYRYFLTLRNDTDLWGSYLPAKSPFAFSLSFQGSEPRGVRDSAISHSINIIVIDQRLQPQLLFAPIIILTCPIIHCHLFIEIIGSFLLSRGMHHLEILGIRRLFSMPMSSLTLHVRLLHRNVIASAWSLLRNSRKPSHYSLSFFPILLLSLFGKDSSCRS